MRRTPQPPSRLPGLAQTISLDSSLRNRSSCSESPYAPLREKSAHACPVGWAQAPDSATSSAATSALDDALAVDGYCTGSQAGPVIRPPGGGGGFAGSARGFQRSRLSPSSARWVARAASCAVGA